MTHVHRVTLSILHIYSTQIAHSVYMPQTVIGTDKDAHIAQIAQLSHISPILINLELFSNFVKLCVICAMCYLCYLRKLPLGLNFFDVIGFKISQKRFYRGR